MADHDTSEQLDDSADTASFQRFVEQEGQVERGSTDNDGRTFRLLSLGIGAIVLILIVVLLLQ